MPQASAWYVGNDMHVQVSGLRSSTMATGVYLKNSTSVSLTLWEGFTTSDTTNRLVNATNMSYLSGSNGNYRATIQSTEATALASGDWGVAIIVVDHSGLNAEFRERLRAEYRR